MNRPLSVPFAAILLSACTSDGTRVAQPGDFTKPGTGKWDTSVEAIFIDFEFDAELIASSSFNPQAKIQDQLLYTIGQLNGERSVGRLDQLELSDIETEAVQGGTLIRYHARLPVAWGKKNSVPTGYDLMLPRDVTYGGLQDFTDKYSHDCVGGGAHDVTPGSMWYYYRPGRTQCDLASEDVHVAAAAVSLSSITTTGKYPEYHKVYEDGVLKVVAVFGKFEDGATSNFDAGISSYNRFVRAVKSELEPYGVVTTPADLPHNPGVDNPDVVLTANIGDGKSVEVTVLLINGVRTAGPEFDARYAVLSGSADLIAYNGHSGLGANIRALAGKGHWQTGQWVAVFMNGCDTYAYVDSAILDAHRAVNADDPIGTKYVDMITNAMPSFAGSSSSGTMAFVRGLMSYESPMTYEKMFTMVDSSQVVLVSGEQDNEYVPGGGGGGIDDWQGMSDSGSVERNQEIRHETPVLAPGRYVFELTGTNDADLYVRIGEAPTVQEFDCRPYRASSNETCAVELTNDAPIHVMIRGWASSSEYQLDAFED